MFCIALKAARIFLAARFFLEAVGANWRRQQSAQPLESKLKQLSGKNKLVKENAAASNDEPMNFRENDYGDFKNQACLAFSLNNNSDISMLIEIIFDW